MLLETGNVFFAENKLEKYFYMFYGVETNSRTGCDYIHLYNLSKHDYTHVEYVWFKERKITPICKGTYLRNKQGVRGKIYVIKGFLISVIPEGKYKENAEDWTWDEVTLDE